MEAEDTICSNFFVLPADGSIDFSRPDSQLYLPSWTCIGNENATGLQ